jgi:hypothetical protein
MDQLHALLMALVCCLLATSWMVEASGRHLLATNNTTNTTIATNTNTTGMYYGERYHAWHCKRCCTLCGGLLLHRPPGS